MPRFFPALWGWALLVGSPLGCGGEGPPRRVENTPPPTVAESVPDPIPELAPGTAKMPQVREATPTPTKAEPVTIRVEPLHSGDVTVETMTLARDSLIEATGAGGSKVLSMHDGRDYVARLEVTEADDKGPTKAQLTYERRADQTLQNGKPVRSRTPPLENKPYTLVRAEKSTTVTYADGSEVPRKEMIAVQDANVGFGGPDRFAALLPTGEIEPGHSVELDKARVAPLLEERPRRGQDVERATLTYRGVAEEEGKKFAVFALELVMTKLDGSLQITMKMDGELLFDPANGRLARASFQGPMNVVSEPGAHGGIRMEGGGAVAYDASVKHEHAAK